ncbi:MAG: hypothetical protein ACD_39C00277G0001 [uncultured bacterium]|nr:MAG: hypothetical protein ACD_39C00277G0001 [uncultured bacterium]
MAVVAGHKSFKLPGKLGLNRRNILAEVEFEAEVNLGAKTMCAFKQDLSAHDFDEFLTYGQAESSAAKTAGNR